MTDSLPCGCKLCGCVCTAHSPDRIERPCARHGVFIVTRFVAGEVATLAALALFFGMIGVWAAILS